MTPAERERRRAFLGASEVAAICGLDPFKSALDIWGEKKGLLCSRESDAADMGNELEPLLLARYARKRCVGLRRVGTLLGPHPLAATPDSITEEARPRNVQCKAVGRYMADHWDNGVPDYVQVQTQAEMYVAELDVTDVVALICSTDYRVLEVPRDDRVIGHLVEICSAWWAEYIEGDTLPELDGSETARAILNAMHPDLGEAIKADADLISLATQHEAQAVQLAALKEQHETTRNLIRLRMVGATRAVWPGGRITYKTTKAGDRPLLVRMS
jgi:putative phage-type endonuclease